MNNLIIKKIGIGILLLVSLKAQARNDKIEIFLSSPPSKKIDVEKENIGTNNPNQIIIDLQEFKPLSHQMDLNQQIIEIEKAVNMVFPYLTHFSTSYFLYKGV